MRFSRCSLLLLSLWVAACGTTASRRDPGLDSGTDAGDASGSDASEDGGRIVGAGYPRTLVVACWDEAERGLIGSRASRRSRRSSLGPQRRARALSLLSAHHDPGKVRELKNAIEHAVIMAKGDAIEPGDLPRAIAERRVDRAART